MADMTVCIWPETWADTVLDFRYRRNVDGNIVPTLVKVDNTGAEVQFGNLVEIRGGGGHLECTHMFVGVGVNNHSSFDSDDDGHVGVHY